MFSVQPSSLIGRSLAIAFLVAIAGCQMTDQPLTFTAQQLSTTDQAVSPNQIIRIKGVVVDQVPLADGAIAYELQDATGRIWVLAKQKMANQGDQIEITGKVRYLTEADNLDSRDKVYVELES
ncbi:MAG TPA: hypothetical protein IGS53_12385 [Leptolyngbyaceae cyanobacterium M33_DOE_097]|uniref:NirD/YgiW/YdeI family stress tolerance protein n=1 Tax=Oscillatoriales cyanobacterium SpSt-418 TaxID=2282169 RepID=A0A7C3PGM7_9CYAN|nr:hypothetical protein [Leptolyngbyaceae cyanobacterium M33_DOE_097]